MNETKKVKIEVEETNLGFGKRIKFYTVRNENGDVMQNFLWEKDAIEYESKTRGEYITEEILWTE